MVFSQSSHSSHSLLIHSKKLPREVPESSAESTTMSTRGTNNTALEAIELSSSSSETEATVGGTTVKLRPKLRTSRGKMREQSVDPSPDSSDVAPPTKRRREASKQIQYYEEEEEEEEEADEDATEDYIDHVEPPSEEEKLPQEDTNRRRSGRTRKPVQSVIDLSDDDFVMSSDEEKPKPKPKKKAAPKSKAKGKRKRKSSSSDSSDAASNDESEVEIVEMRVTPESDGFIIDKVLGREVHTLKEWKKICWNKNSRFLTHSSIFLPAEEEEGEKEEQKVEKDGENAASDEKEAPPAPKPSTDDDEVEDAGEERFLIKWKTLSYLHTSWQTEDELLETDKNAKGKIQRFREKEFRALYSQNLQGDEYFNPEFRSVDRILEIRDRPLDDFAPDDSAGENEFQYFLVKWKALSYDEITWEREDDVNDDAAVEQYNDRVVRAAKRFKKVALAKHIPQNKRKNFRGYTAESPPPRRKEQAFQLRDYQLTGVNWMLFNWYQKRNSMLADEMGLGKTVQTVMYINHLAVVERTPHPFIIVAPLSTLGHWQREFDSWTNLNAVVYHGSATARGVLQNYEFFLSEDELRRADELSGKNNNDKRAAPRPKRNCYRFDVLITTFEMASATDLIKLAQIDWQLMVVDEAHRLKNRNSKLSNILHTRFTYENMLLLTGTPLQNNVEELWVLLNFLDTNRFNSKEDFLESFGELTDSAQVERLHSELKPYLLRRMKEDVEKSLAPKEETIIEVELTVLQKQYYRAIYEKNTEFLSRGGRKGDTPSLMNVLMEIRKCCNHPFLVKGVEEREVKRLTKQTSVSKEEIQRQISESLVDTSGKLVLLDKLLPRLKETGHRVLIFSQFKIMLDILQDYLALRRYNCERIDGNITGNERQSAIDRFCRDDSNSFIMLLSTRAGGVGINLTAADTVIIYDSDWNPQNDLQAQARCHRIGQKKSVKIYRLLTSKTYELHMFHKASLKLGLDQAVLGGIKNDDPVAKLKGTAKKSKTNERMSKEEIENLLKHGAYEMFKEQESEAEAASKQFGEESIDQILSRSTTIVHDPTRDADGNEKKNVMSSFSKATFVSSTNPDEEVDIDDPNFWTKVIGLDGVEEQKKEEPSPLQKRRCRRKVKSYLTDVDRSLMMDDSEDETSSSRKKIFRELGVQKDEEFVISDDDDDDDDDSSDVAFAKDDLLGVSAHGKRKRSKIPVLPIYTYTEIIMDLVGTFGYGRWDDIKRHSPKLGGYSNKELSKFVQDNVTSMVRASTAMGVFPRIGLDLEPSRVYIVSTSIPPPHMGNASPIERYAHELNSSCRRYRFLAVMMQDMRIANLLAVAVPPRMWTTDFQSRAARGFRAKLQQIDTMYKLSEFVRVKVVSPPPLIALIKDLQRVEDEAAVHQMIESGTIPEPADIVTITKNKAPTSGEGKHNDEPSSAEASTADSGENKDLNKSADVLHDETISPTSPDKSETKADAKSEKPSPTDPLIPAVPDENETNIEAKSEEPSSTDPLMPVAPDKSKINAEAKTEKPSPTDADPDKSKINAEAKTETPSPTDADPDKSLISADAKTEKPSPTDADLDKSKDAEVKSRTALPTDPSEPMSLENDATEKDVHESNSASAPTTGVPIEEALSGTAAITVSDTACSQEDTEVTESSTLTNKKDDEIGSGKPPREVSAGVDKKESSDTPSAPTPPVSVPEPKKQQNDPSNARVKFERMQAMRILQALPPVDSVEPVAPWWISRVDDVLLLLYVYRDGWIRGRTLPIRMVEATTLFGDRAKRYPTSEWPTLGILNRRLKILLHVWTTVKKTKPIAPATTTITGAFGVTSAKHHKHQLHLHEKLQQQLQREEEQQRARQAHHYSNTSFQGTRHNQFAKLVFSYGIPDVSTCRDERERNEKWRYFLQDSQLGIGHHPLEELLAEALDLERVCRQRLHSEGVDNIEPTEENSILGGKRGFWLLTTTQCRRLLHRVDLFRLLRTQILVLPPAQLVELVSRVVRAQSASTDYPGWWNCPRHDILLLQGVECYGLDEHLASVWKLPLFNSANKLNAFPSSSWVENYITELAFACRNLIVKARSYRSDGGYIDLSNGETRDIPGNNRFPQQNPEAETRRRIRDIRGMRSEDPYFTPTVRLRQLIESNAAREQEVKRREKKPSTEEQKDQSLSSPTPAKEIVQTKQEDPQILSADKPKRDERETKRSEPSDGSSDENEEKSSSPVNSNVIHLKNDNDVDGNSEEEEKKSSPVRTSRRSRSTSVARAPEEDQKDDVVKSPAAVATAAAEAKREQSAVRPWDVIVIDSSDDSE
ncbi:Chromodomain protein [Phytophthora megakarya]|uniref:Chromodomain protein n=1 Tax=Phytophthora megakarya TaxID=4795 RepID=A0A225WFZ8_9STRA|nr:Chromodomain protein [Phytophthora megakarya]